MGIFDFLTPKADGLAYDPMRLPAGADPENDPVVGYDELGQKIRRSRFDGTQYLFEMAPPKTQSVIKGAYREATANPLGFTGDLLSNAVQSAWDAISVPRRAMEGQPLTYGDIAGLTGMMTLGAGAGTAPAGALRMGAARDGRPPLTFADVERVMMAPFDMGRGIGDNGGPPLRDVARPRGYERVGLDIAENLSGVPSAAEISGRGPTSPGAGMTDVKSQKPTALSGSYSRGFMDEELVAPIQSSIADLEGRTLMGIVGDTSGRQRVTQVNEDVFETPIDTQGGFQYMDRPGQGYAGAQTATSSKLNEASKTEDPFYISILMGEQSPDFAVPTSQIFGQMLKGAPIATKNIPTIDEAIRNIGMSVVKKKIVDGQEVKYSETIYPFRDFKSIGTSGYFDEYVAGLPTGTQRAALLKGLDKANLQKMGLPKVSDARAAMMDEAQIGMDWGSTGYRGFTPDVERGAFLTTPDQSLTYQAGVDKVGAARTLTGQGRGIPYALTFPDLAAELRAKGTGGGLEMTSPAYKVFEGSPKRAKQPVTPLVVDLVSTFREMEDRFGRRSALGFARDTLKDMKVTKEMIEAARRANAPTWMIALMSSAALLSQSPDEEGI
jgi:hypothetical protein